jgi:hypothetical protein
MIMVSANNIQLVEITTDQREYQLWAAATGPAEALTRVIEPVPEGWTATLRLTLSEVEGLNLLPGEVRRLATVLGSTKRSSAEVKKES